MNATGFSPADYIVGADDRILVTGATGFIGAQVVARLLERGFSDLRCLVRPSSSVKCLTQVLSRFNCPRQVVLTGNLLHPSDCAAAMDGVRVVLHLAAGRGQKSFADAFANSVVATRNLLDACIKTGAVRRFVNVGSFAGYSNRGRTRGRTLDESCPLEEPPHQRGEAYVYAKVRQDQIVMDFGRRHSLPFVIVRPGVVYGSGNEGISGRIGVGTFGLFLHLGGSNRIPLTHVRNCADAIVLAGLVGGIDHQVFNIVDDDLPTSRQFLREYKRRVRSFHSVYMPKLLSYGLCALIEKYSEWSRGQVPPFMNRHMWHAYWKSTHYSNERAKRLLGWAPSISMSEGLHSYFESCRRAIENPPAVRSQTPPV